MLALWRRSMASLARRRRKSAISLLRQWLCAYSSIWRRSKSRSTLPKKTFPISNSAKTSVCVSMRIRVKSRRRRLRVSCPMSIRHRARIQSKPNLPMSKTAKRVCIASNRVCIRKRNCRSIRPMMRSSYRPRLYCSCPNFWNSKSLARHCDASSSSTTT